MATSSVTLTYFACFALLGAVASATTCSLSVELLPSQVEGGMPEPSCNTACDDGQISMWYEGVIYKRTDDLLNNYGAMVAVEFTNGEITGCKLVPYASDEDLAQFEAEMESCLSYFQTTTSPAPTTESSFEVTECPFGYSPVGNSCFMVTPKIQNQRNGAAICQQFGGDIAIIENEEKQNLIANTIDATFFIGLTDETVEGEFVDMYNRKSEYTNWRDGEPNNSGGEEDCVIVKPGSGYKWWDFSCAEKKRSLCEAYPYSYVTPGCAEGQLSFGGSCYFSPNRDYNFNGGSNACIAEGGNLAMINSQEEQDFLAQNLDQSMIISLTDSNSEGLFVDSNFGLPIYTNWGESQPLANGGSKDCVIVDSSAGFTWTNVACGTKRRVLCEIPAPQYMYAY